jgi:succinyl-diaminopimelate desuccinylase
MTIRYDVAEATALTRAMVAIQSYPGAEHAVQQYVVEWFATQGITAEVWPTSAAPNVVVRLENGVGPTLMLNGHTDTVLAAEGWECDPWQERIDGNRLYGLGACDMKSGMAAIMLVTREMHRHRDVWSGTLIMSAVVDEEAYSVGANALIEQGIKADFCIVAEAYHPKIGIGAAGKVLVKADVIGKAAHGFMPWQGINAASEGSRFVVGVDQLPLGTHERIPASQSVLSFLSGSAQYVVTVPERAEILVSRQIVPGENRESVKAQMQGVVDGLKSPARIELSTPPPYYPSFEIATEHPLVQAVVAAYVAEWGTQPELAHSTGVSDANLIAELAGIPTLLYGPDGGDFHQCNEWVDLPSIVACCNVYTQVIQALMPRA